MYISIPLSVKCLKPKIDLFISL